MESGDLQTISGKSAAGPVTDPSGTIVFDTASGISIEEQEQIVDVINAITGKNRLVPEATVAKPKKRGFLFPLFVNICGLILLGFGFVLLSHFHGQDEQSIRESSANLGVTERKLIQEIRQETNRKLSEKDNEINGILSKLSAADAEYKALQGSVESLTEEQKQRAASLLKMQDDYRNSLLVSQNEKAAIIEDSRRQETGLRTQAEERARELSSQIEQSQASLSQATEELRRLSNEQDRAARVEAQMSGYYTTVNNQIVSGRLDEAAATIKAMKEFLNASLLQGIKSLEARRQNHLAAVAAVETALDEARRLKAEAVSPGALISSAAQAETPAPLPAAEEPGNGAANEALRESLLAQEERYAALEQKYTALEQKTLDQEKTIAAYSSQGSEQGRIIAGFETTINELRTENASLSTANLNQQQTLNRRDSEIVSLRTDTAAAQQQITELNNSMTDLQSQIQAANSRLSENETALAAFRTQVQTANTRAEQSDAAAEEQKQQNSDLTQMNSELQGQNAELQRQLDVAREAARIFLQQGQ